MSTKTEALRQFFAAVNRNDMQAMIKDFDPQITRVEPEGFFEKGDKVVVYLHARVRLKDSTDWVGGRFADGFAFRDGRITQYLTFGQRPDALKWAGVDPE